MIISPESRVVLPDLSKYDPYLNPDEYVSAGIKYAIIRIGSGDAGEDPLFRTNARLLVDAGITVMGYWWVDPTNNAADQAVKCVSIVQASGLPVKFLWGDCERWWTDWSWYFAFIKGKMPFTQDKVIPSAALNGYYYTFMSELAHRFQKTGIYCGKGFVQSWCPQMAGWLHTYPLWLAQYPKEVTKGAYMTWEAFRAAWLPAADPDMRGMSKEYPLQLVGHQFTGDHVRLPGAYSQLPMVPTNATVLDVNVFKASFCEALVSETMPTIPATPTPGEDKSGWMFDAIVLTGAVNIRNAPSGTAKILFTRPQSAILSIYCVSGDWGKIDPIQEQWVFLPNLRKIQKKMFYKEKDRA